MNENSHVIFWQKSACVITKPWNQFVLSSVLYYLMQILRLFRDPLYNNMIQYNLHFFQIYLFLFFVSGKLLTIF